MTGTICSVTNCNSNSERAKKDGILIRFFTFPKKPKILKQWVSVCKRKGPFDPKNKRICSKHFALDQYEDEIEAQLTNKMPKKLKETAIPSLNLPLLPEKIVRERSKRTKLKEKKQVIENPLMDEDTEVLPQDIPACNSNISLQDIQSPYEILLQKYIALQEQCEKLKNEAQQDKAKIENLIAANKKLQLIADHSQTKLVSKLNDFLTSNKVEVLVKNKPGGTTKKYLKYFD